MFFLLMLNFFALTVSAMTAVVNASFWLAVLLFIWKKCKSPDFSFLYKPVLGKLFLLFLLCFAVSWGLNGDLASNNANEFYKDHLKHLVMFVLVADTCKTWRQGYQLLLAFSAGAAIRAILIMATYTGLGNWPDLENGVALDAIFYFTLTGCALFFSTEYGGRVRLLLALSLLLQFVPLVSHGSRTPLIAIALGLVFAAIIGKYYRALLMVGGVMIVAGGAIAVINPSLMERYVSPLKMATYHEDGNLKERKGIWLVMTPLIAKKPLFGYGPGWRKLAILVQKDNNLAYFKQQPFESVEASAYRYFDRIKMKYGRANPHSLYMQALFEIGAVGLAFYLLFLAVAFFKALRMARAPSVQFRAMGVSFVALVVAYLIVGLTNGLMAGSISIMFMMALMMNMLQLQGEEGV